MKGILAYQPPDKPAQLPEFIDSLDPRLREKIIMQLYQLSKPHKPELREPHFKRFSLERYRDLCELRVKSKMLVRIIFCFCCKRAQFSQKTRFLCQRCDGCNKMHK